MICTCAWENANHKTAWFTRLCWSVWKIQCQHFRVKLMYFDTSRPCSSQSYFWMKILFLITSVKTYLAYLTFDILKLVSRFQINIYWLPHFMTCQHLSYSCDFRYQAFPPISCILKRLRSLATAKLTSTDSVYSLWHFKKWEMNNQVGLFKVLNLLSAGLICLHVS